MLRTNIILFFRNFKKSSLYATLNILGLSLTIAVVGLVIMYIHYELNYESFHTKADRIYRVTYKTESQNGDAHWARVPVDFVNLLPEEINGIRKLIRFQNHEEKFIKIGTRKFREKHVYQTDPEVFDVFSFDFLHGNPATALADPRSIVLTESLARKYFGGKTGLEEKILLSGTWDPEPVSYKVTGIIRDTPSNTHLPVNMLISFDGPEQRTWWSYTYVLLEAEAEAADLTPEIHSFVERHSRNEAQRESFVLQPLNDIHLKSNLAREIIPNGSWQNVKIFAGIGFLVLLVGFINFTNIGSVIFLSRLKEVGVRKVMGAINRQLAFSIILETMLSSFLALLVGGALIFASYPFFQDFTGSSLLIDPLAFVGLLMGISMTVGVLAGIYPALISGKIQSLQLLKKNMPAVKVLGNSFFSLKKVMLTLQFSIATLLICCALVASDQFSFVKHQNLKMKPEQLLALTRIPNQVKEQYPVFKEKLSKIAGVQSVSVCMQVPSSEIRDAGFFTVPDLHTSKKEAPTFDIQVVGHEFFELMNIELVAGEFFPEYIKPRVFPEFTESYTYQDYLAAQPRAYLINETALSALGLKDPHEAIGKQASFELVTELKQGPVVGVIEDYHQASLKNAIDPTIYVYEPLWFGNILLRMETDNIVDVMDDVEASWNELFPNVKIEYQFLDELYNEQYNSERKQLDLLYLFSILTVIIAFLGIFGLVAHTLKTRLKELAIRKVLGANVNSLIQLVSKEYIILLSLGLLLASPVGFFTMTHWLENFAYRTDISPISFFSSFILMGVVLGGTVIIQTLKTTTSNPVNSLKDE